MLSRIKSILEYSGLNQKLFAKRVGISESTLSNILKGRSEVTLAITQKIRSAFPQINPSWLLDGIGDMFSAESNADTGDVVSETPINNGIYNNVVPSQPIVPQNMSSSVNFGTQQVPNNYHMTFPSNFNNEKNPDKTRKVKEIQIFYDDGTYEVFVPRK